MHSQSLTTKIAFFVAGMCIFCTLIGIYAIQAIERTCAQMYTYSASQDKALAHQLGTIESFVTNVPIILEQTSLSHSQKKALIAQTEQMLLAQLSALPSLASTEQATVHALQIQVQQLLHTAALHSASPTHSANSLSSTTQNIAAIQTTLDSLLARSFIHFAPLQKATLLAQSLLILCALILVLGSAWITHKVITRPLRQLLQSVAHMLPTEQSAHTGHPVRCNEISATIDAIQQLQELVKKKLNPALQPTTLPLLEQHHLEHTAHVVNKLPCVVFEMRLPPRGTLSISFINSAWSQLFDVVDTRKCDTASAVEVIFQQDPVRARTLQQAFRTSAKTCRPVDVLIPVSLRDGTTRWLKTYAQPSLGADGLTSFFGVWFDASEDFLQRQALQKTQQVAADMAKVHCQLPPPDRNDAIRTPLNTILRLVKLLLQANLSPVQHEQLRSVLLASQHLRNIVNEAADLSKIKLGQLQLEIASFHLESLLLNVLDLSQELAEQKGLELEYEVSPEIPEYVTGDPLRIAQILLKFIHNAVQLIQAGSIQINVHPSNTGNDSSSQIALQFSIKTLKAQSSKRQLQTAQAISTSSSSPAHPSFNTLVSEPHIYHALAQLMGGSIGTSYAPESGYTLWLNVVLQRTENSIATRATHPAHSAPLDLPSNLRLLVVDEDPSNRTTAKEMLQRMGFHTEVAADGAQALYQLQTKGPEYFHAVLIALQMPQMEGLSVAQAIRSTSGLETLPIIAVTTLCSAQDIERTRAVGMNAQLSKPLTETALKGALQQCLGKNTLAPINIASGEVQHPVFDPNAIHALAQLFENAKLHQLVEQFIQDTQPRAQHLPSLAEKGDWQAIRLDAHKITGTAATFGLLQLGYLGAEISKALSTMDMHHATALVQQAAESAATGLTQLRTYMEQHHCAQ